MRIRFRLRLKEKQKKNEKRNPITTIFPHRLYLNLKLNLSLNLNLYARPIEPKEHTFVLITSEQSLSLSLNDSKNNYLKITNKYILGKFIRKNRGNSKLLKSVQQLISDIEQNEWKTPHDLTENRPDADCVYGGGFYFFNINIHRTLILIEFEESGEATIVWAGSHDDYEQTFKNNKNVIKKWLRENNWI